MSNSEPIRAHVTKHHLLRLTFIALITCGFSAYCFYDGFVGYPRQREYALEYQKWKSKEGAKLEEWHKICEERGWVNHDPGEPKTEADIQMQFVMGGITALIGIPVLVNLLRTLGRSLEGTPEGIKASWGPEFKFSQVTRIDKRKWDSKGIARITYVQDGKPRRFVLDDYIFDRPATDEMMRWMEKKAGVDKIVNGKPEPPVEIHAEAEANS